MRNMRKSMQIKIAEKHNSTNMKITIGNNEIKSKL